MLLTLMLTIVIKPRRPAGDVNVISCFGFVIVAAVKKFIKSLKFCRLSNIDNPENHQKLGPSFFSSTTSSFRH